jgi:lysophospholipase L1-like esterase
MPNLPRKCLPVLALAPAAFAVGLAGWCPSQASRQFLGFSLPHLLSLGAASCLLLVAAAAGLRRAPRTAAVAALGLFAWSYAIVLNRAFSAIPFADALLVVARWGLAVFALGLLARGLARARGAPSLKPLLALWVALFTLATVSAGVFATQFARGRSRPQSLAFREPVDLRGVGPNTVVVVGDSFVWGQGVRKEEAFPSVLRELLARAGDRREVVNLGLNGADAVNYLAVLKLTPVKNRSVVCLYPNDMPARQTRAMRAFDILCSLSRTDFLARCVAQAMNARLHGANVVGYHEALVADFDPADATFPQRWALLAAQLRAVGTEAARGSTVNPPLLVIFPLMVDFRAYPLEASHRDLAALGKGCGFEVLDMLPHFRDRLGDGSRHHPAPNDNHFDAETHRLVAGILRAALAPAR